MTLDYSEVSSTIMLQGGGAESMPIMVPIINDILVEDNETLTLVFTVLSDSGNIATYSPSMATITILDIDGRGSLPELDGDVGGYDLMFSP